MSDPLPTAGLSGYIRAMPKVELHLHLEGSMRPALLLEIAERNGFPLPHNTLEGLREWYRFQNFEHFIEIYSLIVQALQKPEDWAQITYDLGQRLAAQNCRYAEVTWTPNRTITTFEHFLEVLAAVNDGRQRAARDFGVEMRWIPDIVRNEHVKRGEEVATWITSPQAVEGGVVALGLGGLETGHLPKKFEWTAAIAMDNAVPYNPHAGEVVGPESVWQAILILKAQRIGHGVRSIEDPELVAYLAEREIPLEVCPTSNVLLGVFPSYEQHSLKALADAGVIVTINSDDPPMFNTTLTGEYLHAVQDCGLTLAQLEKAVLDGVRVSYLPDEQKAALLAEYQAEMARLRAEWLAD